MENTKFNDTTIIRKNDTTFPEHLDFELLRREGLTHIGELSGNIWTDHNVHDPGVSILELLCYALIDIGYRTKLPIADILALNEKNGQTEDNFFTPAQILTCNPTTIIDYRKLLMDVDGVRHAWLEVSDDYSLYLNCGLSGATGGQEDEKFLTCKPTTGYCPVTLNGLYDIYLELDRGSAFCLDKDKEGGAFDEKKVIEEVKKQLYQHRNLCEDFIKIQVLCEQEIGLCADVEISEGEDPEVVYAKIIQQVNRFLTPEINYYTLQELLRKGKAIEEIFEGKPMTKESFGFVDTEELLKAERIKEIHLSDIYKLILEMKEVRSVNNLKMTGWINNQKITDSSYQDNNAWDPECEAERDIICQGWILSIVENYVPRLCLGRSCLNIKSEEVYLKTNPDRIEMLLRQSISTVQKVKYNSSKYLDIPIPNGNYRPELGTYYSIQNEMPRTYGIGEGGLPSTATNLRKSQAYQLKGYLLFFDQLLSGYLSQLSHVRDLFSIAPDSQRPIASHQTYFLQAFDSVPQIEKLIRFHGDPEGTSITEGTTLAILITNDSDLEVQLEVIRDGFIDFELDYKEYRYDATYKRNIALEQFQREFQQGEITVEILQEKRGFFFIAYTQLSKAILLSYHQYCTYKEAKTASEILTMLGDQESLYQPINEYSDGKFSFELIYRQVDYLQLLQDILEDKEAYLQRRESFLNHLMARFAEDFTSYSISLFNQSIELDKRVEQKANFLSQYPEISRNRGRAFNYCEEVWGTDNISGLERRVGAIAGLGNEKKGPLCNFDVYTYGDEKVIQIVDLDGNVIFRGSEIYESTEAAQQALDALCEALKDESKYQHCKTLPDGSYSFSVAHELGLAHYARSFKTKEECKEERIMVINWFVEQPQASNIFVSKEVHRLSLKKQDGVSEVIGKKEFATRDLALQSRGEFAELINSGKEKAPQILHLIPAVAADNKFINFEPLKKYFELSSPFFKWNIRNEKGEILLISTARLNDKNIAAADFLSTISLDPESILIQERKDGGNLILELKKNNYVVASGVFAEKESKKKAKEYLDKSIANLSNQLIRKTDKAYKWQLQNANGDILLRSQLVYSERRMAEHDGLELRNYVNKKDNFKVQAITDRECVVHVYFKDQSLRAISEKMDNKPEQIDQFVKEVQAAIANKKNFKYPRLAEAYAYKIPGGNNGEEPLFISYHLYDDRAQALMALQKMLENVKDYKTFNTGDQANLNYSFYLQDKNKSFIALHPETYTSAGERTKVKNKVVSGLRKYNLPVGFEEEYNYAIINQEGLRMLTSERYFSQPQEAAQQFYITFQKAATPRNYKFVEKRGKYIAELRENKVLLARSPAAINNKQLIEDSIKVFKTSIAENEFEVDAEIHPKEWKFNYLWTREEQKLQPLFISNSTYKSYESAEKAYSRFSKNILQVSEKQTGSGKVKRLTLSTTDAEGELKSSVSGSAQKLSETQRTLKAVKAFQGQNEVIKSIIDNPAGGNGQQKKVFRILKNNDPIAYHPCACFDREQDDSPYGGDPLKDETIKKLCDKAARGYEYLEICMAGDICVIVDEKYHYVIRDKNTGEIYMVSYEGYSTEAQAKEAFLENYLAIIDLASDVHNYIIEEEEILLGKPNPIACIQQEAWDKFNGNGKDFAYWFCTYPIRRIKKTSGTKCEEEVSFEYCFQLICYPPVGQDPYDGGDYPGYDGDNKPEEECKEDWLSTKCYPSPEEAKAAFRHFLYLLEFKGSINAIETYDEKSEKCCERIGLFEILIESTKRYETDSQAWEGLNDLLKVACNEEAFYTEMTRECCFTFKIVKDCFQLARHPFYYDRVEERNEAIEQLIEHCSTIQKTNLTIEPIPVGNMGSRYVTSISEENGQFVLTGRKSFAGDSNARDYAYELLTYARDRRFYGKDNNGVIYLLNVVWPPTQVIDRIAHQNNILAEFSTDNASIEELIRLALHYPFYKKDDCYRFRVYCDKFKYLKSPDPEDCGPCNEENEDDEPIIETGAIVWESNCDYKTLEEAEEDFKRFCSIQEQHLLNEGNTFSHTLRDHFRSTGENNCGELGIEFIDPERVLAFHPQCYDRQVELNWAIERTKECINADGMHLIEHILLRPNKSSSVDCPDNTSQEAYPCLLSIDPDCNCKLEIPSAGGEDCLEEQEQPDSSTSCLGKYIPGADPYSFVATVILPCWTKRFHSDSYREVFKELMRKETPAHIALRFIWITPQEMCAFEKAFTTWMHFMKNDNYCDPTNELCNLVSCLKALNNCGTDPEESNEPACDCGTEQEQDYVYLHKFDRYLTYMMAPEKKALKEVDALEPFLRGSGVYGKIAKGISATFLANPDGPGKLITDQEIPVALAQPMPVSQPVEKVIEEKAVEKAASDSKVAKPEESGLKKEVAQRKTVPQKAPKKKPVTKKAVPKKTAPKKAAAKKASPKKPTPKKTTPAPKPKTTLTRQQVAKNIRQREAGYTANIESGADNNLKKTKSYKLTDFFLTSGGDQNGWTDLVNMITRYSLGKKDGPGKEKYLMLLRNATWYFLDKLVISHPNEMQHASILKEQLSLLKEHGMDLKAMMRDWKGTQLGEWLNATIVKKYLDLGKI